MTQRNQKATDAPSRAYLVLAQHVGGEPKTYEVEARNALSAAFDGLALFAQATMATTSPDFCAGPYVVERLDKALRRMARDKTSELYMADGSRRTTGANHRAAFWAGVDGRKIKAVAGSMLETAWQAGRDFARLETRTDQVTP